MKKRVDEIARLTEEDSRNPAGNSTILKEAVILLPNININTFSKICAKTKHN